jgi:hypothetical protein
MRRFALALIAAAGVSVVSACGGSNGVSVGNSSNPAVIEFRNGSDQTQLFLVAPGATPLEVFAVGRTSDGLVIANTTVSWSAGYAATGAQYESNISGQTKSCGTPASTPAIPLLLQAPTGSASPFVPYAAGQYTQYIFVEPPADVVPAGTSTNYCIELVARSPGGTLGSVVIAVGSAP